MPSFYRMFERRSLAMPFCDKPSIGVLNEHECDARQIRCSITYLVPAVVEAGVDNIPGKGWLSVAWVTAQFGRKMPAGLITKQVSIRVPFRVFCSQPKREPICSRELGAAYVAS
jgi:hypothetical protein